MNKCPVGLPVFQVAISGSREHGGHATHDLAGISFEECPLHEGDYFVPGCIKIFCRRYWAVKSSEVIQSRLFDDEP